MENERNEVLSVEPQIDEQPLAVEGEATTPSPQPEGSPKEGITLKFNKELREIPYDEVVALAQKGLKFDTILPDFARLKNIAGKEGKSISEYITEIENARITKRREELLVSLAGNEELADHILSLEAEAEPKNEGGFSLLAAEFPEIKSVDDLPSEVVQSVELLGGNLLAAYLLYNHRQQKEVLRSREKQLESSRSSVGSLSSHSNKSGGANEEFIKAIWS